MNKESQGMIQLRRPVPEDGSAIWSWVREAGGLDLNSVYCYILLCDYFRDSSIVAEWDGKLAGFAAGFRPPGRPDVLFIWQIGVAEPFRRTGLGKKMLHGIVQHLKQEGIRYLEGTVGPDNMASRTLFQRMAKDLGAPFRISEGYSKSLFPRELQHDDELLLTIGPFQFEGGETNHEYAGAGTTFSAGI